MKLSSDILFQDLAKHVTLESFGVRRPDLSLEPPIFIMRT